MIDIYIFDINKDLVDVDKMYNALPLVVKKHLHRYHNTTSYQLSLLVWYQLCKILQDKYNIKLNDDNLIFNSNNKPYIVNNPIYFNLSHSLHLVAIAIANKEVGIDIEQIHECKNIQKYKRFLNITTLNNSRELIKAWTIYEAKVKCLGISIFNKDELDEINFSLIDTKEIKDSQNNQYFLTICKK